MAKWIDCTLSDLGTIIGKTVTYRGLHQRIYLCLEEDIFLTESVILHSRV